MPPLLQLPPLPPPLWLLKLTRRASTDTVGEPNDQLLLALLATTAGGERAFGRRG